jgi:hypothetical protein
MSSPKKQKCSSRLIILQIVSLDFALNSGSNLNLIVPLVSALYYLKSSGRGVKDSEAIQAARAAYRTIDKSISLCAAPILNIKNLMAGERTKVAHPTVSQKDLDSYIDKLGGDDSDSDLSESPQLEKLFAFLRKTSLSADNVRLSNVH